MKKMNSTRFYFFAVAFFALTSKSQAQRYTNDETTVGLLIESTFSGFDHHGLTPSLTIGCATYQFQVGPRITFEQMAGHQSQNTKNSFWDFGFRYGFFLRHGFTLFASIKCEYGSERGTEDWYYQYSGYNPAQGILLTDYSFNARTEISHYNFNSYLGVGAEIILVDKLYINTNLGVGIKTLSGYTRYSNRDTGELVSESSWLFDNRGASWMISAGVGYRL